ncbi:putative tail protein [Synechococcus virus S-ESS1]|uniref:Putative tail protein n=1 Tax=Synechococcus virus S-ESS1 TaxID=1964565 RepID=A0A1V0DX63_9CAUD|nr:tail protein [Synechococcus virus S-ESS1]ARB05720.1 putative tail protein [Synechococcus virus S-ESS1]
MGGGGKKQKPEVYDFLMSIDYGLCYGPVDQFNQVWVKDKPIWCGAAYERTDIEVNQPELFGGDTGEGGVVGTVELYTGDNEQRSSAQLGGRVGRDVYTMPGYRGLAHMFFRGNLGANEPVRRRFSMIDFFTFNIFYGKARRGFRWTTNNPYLPEVKASVTRLPKSLPTNFAIYRPILDESGNPVEDPNAGGTKPDGLIDWGLPTRGHPRLLPGRSPGTRGEVPLACVQLRQPL